MVPANSHLFTQIPQYHSVDPRMQRLKERMLLLHIQAFGRGGGYAVKFHRDVRFNEFLVRSQGKVVDEYWGYVDSHYRSSSPIESWRVFPPGGYIEIPTRGSILKYPFHICEGWSEYA